MKDKLREILKGIINWCVKPAIVIFGFVLILMLDSSWMNRSSNWLLACQDLFGKGVLSRDILLFLGPLGLVYTGLLAAGVCLFFLLRRGRIPSFPLTAVSIWGAAAVLSWELDWIQRNEQMFLSWVPGLSIAVTILLVLVFAALLVIAQVTGHSREEARGSKGRDRSLRVIGAVGKILVFMLLTALIISLTMLLRYAVVLAFSGKPAGFAILAGLLLLCVPGIVDSIKKHRKEKEEAARAEKVISGIRENREKQEAARAAEDGTDQP